MKVNRLFFLPLAAAGFMCLPVVSAFAATPQGQNQNNAQEHRGERHEQANPGRENRNAQEHRTPQPHQSSNTAQEHRNQGRGNYSQQERMRENQTSARNRGNQHLPAYNFGTREQQQLRQAYDRGNYRREVNARNRPRLTRGGYLPRGWQGRMHPIPPEYVTVIPAPPPGYLLGYFDGYAVVYDPNTGLILQFINVY